jgi:ABC-type nitrate/sulfonate/bicarbonate transport system substrate-binding protein
MLLTYYLEQNGMSIDDVKVSAMKVPSMNDALKTNKIDGLNYHGLSEPWIFIGGVPFISPLV